MTQPTSPVPAPAPAPAAAAPSPAPAVVTPAQPAAAMLGPQAAPQYPVPVQPTQPVAPTQVVPAAQLRPAGALTSYGQGAPQRAQAPSSPVEQVGAFVQKNQRELVAAGLGALAISLLRGGSVPSFGRGPGRGGNGG